MNDESLLEKRTIHGEIVVVRIVDRPLVERGLDPAEEAFVTDLPPVRQATFAGGRSALRRALLRAGLPYDGPILPNDRGAPTLPRGWVGSISHKGDVAVALASRADGRTRGVDLEVIASPKARIESRVLTRREQAVVASLDKETFVRELLLRFSLKEAIYKAIDPYVGRYVAFDEVDIVLAGAPHATADLHLTRGEGPFQVELLWEEWNGFMVTSAAIERR